MPSLDWTNAIVAIYGTSAPAGTGFVVSAGGLILTCAHVLADAGWTYQAWTEPVQVRFKAGSRFAMALVQEECFSSQAEGDFALLALQEPLPDGVEVLKLWRAARAAGRSVAMFGYPEKFRDGLGGEGGAVAVVPRGGRSVLQLRSTETTRGFSGGPVWQPEWKRVIGMVQEGLKADAMGRLAFTCLAIPAEALVEQCPTLLSLAPPESLIVQATRHISGANRDLVGSYTARPFFGRDQAMARLDRWREENSSGRLVVTALAGFGKTALLANWLRRRQALGDFVAYHFFSNRDDNLRPLANAYANLLGQLSEYYGLPDETLPEEDARESRLRAMIEENKPASERPLIILLDALDECDRPFRLPLPQALPDGVYLVASARASNLEEDGELPAYLEGWAGGAATIHLERLPSVAQAGWLGAAGDGILLAESRDPAFLARLDQVSDGYPLYLRYLLDDLVAAKAAGRSPAELLDQPARGFGDYAASQLRGLARDLGREKEIQEFFVLLAVARYPLNEDEVVDLAGLTIFDLADLPPGLTRWLNVGQDESGRRQYALAHARLNDEFENALRGAAAKKRQELLAWCASVPDHRSPYALRYRADLLLHAESYDALHKVALDGEYAALQRAVLPSEPDLPLHALRLALDAAAGQGQSLRIVECLAEHARRLQTLRAASPLAAVRTTPGAVGLSTAWTLSDANEAEVRVLWLLLLAWELVEAGRPDEAESTLARLRAGPRPILEDTAADLALRLAQRLLARWPTMVPPICAEILTDRKLERLVYRLLADGEIQEATWLTGLFREEEIRDVVLRRVMVAVAEAGVYESVDLLSVSIKDPWQLSLAMRQIAVNAAGSGDFDTAAHYLQAVRFDGLLAGGLAFVAEALAGHGRADEAAARFDEAIAAARQLTEAADGAFAWKDIALALGRSGRMDFANEALDSALEAAALVDDPERRDTVLARIAQVQAQIGLMAEALVTVSRIEDEDWRSETVYDLGAGLSALGRPAEAEAYSEHLAEERDRSMLLARIVSDQAWAGDFQGAISSFDAVKLAEDQIWALTQLASAQARADQVVAAKETLARLGDLLGQVDEYHRAVARAQMAEVYAACADSAAAAEHFARALEEAARVEPAESRQEALLEIADAQARGGDGQASRATSATMLIDMAASPGEEDQPERVPVLLVEVLAGIGQTLAAAGDDQGAAEAFIAALAAVDRLPQDADPDELLVTIGAAQARAGQRAAAEATRDRAGDAWAAGQISQQIALGEAAADLQQAMQLAAAIADETVAAETYGAIAMAAHVQGQESLASTSFEAAAALAGQAGSDSIRVDILVQLAGDLFRAGRPDQAAEQWDAALQSAGHIDSFMRDLAYDRLAEAQAAAGFAGLANDTLALIDEQWRAGARARVAIALADAGDLENAREAAIDLEDPDDLVQVYIALARAAYRQGDQAELLRLLDAAERQANELVHGDDRYELLSALAVAEVNTGRSAEALRLAGQILAGREVHLPPIALALAERADARYFSQLLPLCAADLPSALAICPAIATLYPDQARDIAHLVASHDWG